MKNRLSRLEVRAFVPLGEGSLQFSRGAYPESNVEIARGRGIDFTAAWPDHSPAIAFNLLAIQLCKLVKQGRVWCGRSWGEASVRFRAQAYDWCNIDSLRADDAGCRAKKSFDFCALLFPLLIVASPPRADLGYF